MSSPPPLEVGGTSAAETAEAPILQRERTMTSIVDELLVDDEAATNDLRAALGRAASSTSSSETQPIALTHSTIGFVRDRSSVDASPNEGGISAKAASSGRHAKGHWSIGRIGASAMDAKSTNTENILLPLTTPSAAANVGTDGFFDDDGFYHDSIEMERKTEALARVTTTCTMPVADSRCQSQSHSKQPRDRALDSQWPTAPGLSTRDTVQLSDSEKKSHVDFDSENESENDSIEDGGTVVEHSIGRANSNELSLLGAASSMTPPLGECLKATRRTVFGRGRARPSATALLSATPSINVKSADDSQIGAKSVVFHSPHLLSTLTLTGSEQSLLDAFNADCLLLKQAMVSSSISLSKRKTDGFVVDTDTSNVSMYLPIAAVPLPTAIDSRKEDDSESQSTAVLIADAMGQLKGGFQALKNVDTGDASRVLLNTLYKQKVAAMQSTIRRKDECILSYEKRLQQYADVIQQMLQRKMDQESGALLQGPLPDARRNGRSHFSQSTAAASSKSPSSFSISSIGSFFGRSKKTREDDSGDKNGTPDAGAYLQFQSMPRGPSSVPAPTRRRTVVHRSTSSLQRLVHGRSISSTTPTFTSAAGCHSVLRKSQSVTVVTASKSASAPPQMLQSSIGGGNGIPNGGAMIGSLNARLCLVEAQFERRSDVVDVLKWQLRSLIEVVKESRTEMDKLKNERDCFQRQLSELKKACESAPQRCQCQEKQKSYGIGTVAEDDSAIGSASPRVFEAMRSGKLRLDSVLAQQSTINDTLLDDFLLRRSIAALEVDSDDEKVVGSGLMKATGKLKHLIGGLLDVKSLAASSCSSSESESRIPPVAFSFSEMEFLTEKENIPVISTTAMAAESEVKKKQKKEAAKKLDFEKTLNAIKCEFEYQCRAWLSGIDSRLLQMDAVDTESISIWATADCSEKRQVSAVLSTPLPTSNSKQFSEICRNILATAMECKSLNGGNDKDGESGVLLCDLSRELGCLKRLFAITRRRNEVLADSCKTMIRQSSIQVRSLISAVIAKVQSESDVKKEKERAAAVESAKKWRTRASKLKRENAKLVTVMRKFIKSQMRKLLNWRQHYEDAAMHKKGEKISHAARRVIEEARHVLLAVIDAMQQSLTDFKRKQSDWFPAVAITKASTIATVKTVKTERHVCDDRLLLEDEEEEDDNVLMPTVSTQTAPVKMKRVKSKSKSSGIVGKTRLRGIGSGVPMATVSSSTRHSRKKSKKKESDEMVVRLLATPTMQFSSEEEGAADGKKKGLRKSGSGTKKATTSTSLLRTVVSVKTTVSRGSTNSATATATSTALFPSMPSTLDLDASATVQSGMSGKKKAFAAPPQTSSSRRKLLLDSSDDSSVPKMPVPSKSKRQLALRLPPVSRSAKFRRRAVAEVHSYDEGFEERRSARGIQRIRIMRKPKMGKAETVGSVREQHGDEHGHGHGHGRGRRQRGSDKLKLSTPPATTRRAVLCDAFPDTRSVTSVASARGCNGSMRLTAAKATPYGYGTGTGGRVLQQQHCQCSAAPMVFGTYPYMVSSMPCAAAGGHTPYAAQSTLHYPIAPVTEDREYSPLDDELLVTPSATSQRKRRRRKHASETRSAYGSRDLSRERERYRERHSRDRDEGRERRSAEARRRRKGRHSGSESRRRRRHEDKYSDTCSTLSTTISTISSLSQFSSERRDLSSSQSRSRRKRRKGRLSEVRRDGSRTEGRRKDQRKGHKRRHRTKY